MPATRSSTSGTPCSHRAALRHGHADRALGEDPHPLGQSNRVHALLTSFARNPLAFHRRDGAGYRLVGAAVERLDASMPQVAARLATAFGSWRRFGRRVAGTRVELERLAACVHRAMSLRLLERSP